MKVFRSVAQEGVTRALNPYTVEVKGQLTPEQKQELLDHVDEQNLPPEQKKQAKEDIKKADGWFKSVANFFKKNVKSILAFTAFVTIGLGISVAHASNVTCLWSTAPCHFGCICLCG